MKKANSILVTLLSVTMLFGCGMTDGGTPMVPAKEAEASSSEQSVTESADAEEKEIPESYKDVRYVSILDTYDPNNEETFENGMWTEVKDQDDENEFLSYFFDDSSEIEKTEYTNAEVYTGTEDGENIFVMLIGYGDYEYHKSAYGFKYSLDDYKVVAKYDAGKTGDEVYDSMLYSADSEIDSLYYLKPLMDYHEKEYVKDDNGATIKVEYSSDTFTYGTYNSSGTLYYDSLERPVYRDYYVTSGRRCSYYIYDDQGEISQILDFGGMPYKGLEENDDIAIGVDFEVYMFER